MAKSSVPSIYIVVFESGNYKNNEQAAETTGVENQNQGKQGKKNKSKSNKNHQSGPAQKRARVDRTLTEENGSTTIFGLLD